MKWTSKNFKLAELKNNPKNPRLMTRDQEGQLHESIARFGMCEPIVVNQDLEIIGGHQRVRVLQKMGEEAVDVYYPDRLLTQEEAEELLIRLNRNTGEWNIEGLANDWDLEDLIEFGFNAKDLGAPIEEIESAIKEEGNKEGKTVTLTATFTSPEDLQMAELELAPIIESFQGASYKIKV